MVLPPGSVILLEWLTFSEKMAMYEIRFSSAAEKYFKKLKEKKLKDAYRIAMQNIQQNPHAGQRKHGDLNGIYGYDVRYMGINYEIAYTIYEENEQLIVVLLAGTRENFYEQLRDCLEIN
jgi:mRNA interferase RelE/StbE